MAIVFYRAHAVAGNTAFIDALTDAVEACGANARVVPERYAEAVRGDIRMNCDTCAYRIALPGFGDKVGRPRRPHHHPDDPPALDHAHAHHH